MVGFPFQRILFLLFMLVTLTSLRSRSFADGHRWSLDECIAQALKSNVVLNQSKASNEVNKVNLDQSRANRLPNLNLSDAHSLDYGHTLNPVTGVYSNANISSNTMGLNSNVTVFSGLKNINLIRENRLNYEAGNLDIAKQGNDLMLNVVAAYMQVLFELDAVDIAITQAGITEEHLKYTEKYVRAGSLAESTLLQVQAQLATDSASIVEAQNQLQLARVTLMQLMEMPIDPLFEIARPHSADIDPDLSVSAAEVYERATNALPDLKSASAKMKAAEFGVKVARADLYPRLTLGGNIYTSYSSAASLVSYQTTSQVSQIGYLASDPSQVVDGPVYKTNTVSTRYPFGRQFSDNFAQSISINLAVPIYNNRLYKSEIDKSRINLKVAQLGEDLVRNQLRKNIEVACTDQLAAARNYIASRKQLIYETRSFRDMDIKFKAGTVNTTDYFVEKGNYARAIIANLQARYEYIFKTKVVAFYSGNSITQ